MSSIEPSSYIYRIELVTNDSDNELLNNLHTVLHQFIKPVHKDTVDTLVLKIRTKLKLCDGTVEVINSSQNQKERIKFIIEAVKGEKPVNDTALKDFLEILVNFEEHFSLSNKIRELISTKYSHIAGVVPTTTAQTLAPTQQTAGAIVSNYPSEQLNSPSSTVPRNISTSSFGTQEGDNNNNLGEEQSRLISFSPAQQQVSNSRKKSRRRFNEDCVCSTVIMGCFSLIFLIIFYASGGFGDVSHNATTATTTTPILKGIVPTESNEFEVSNITEEPIYQNKSIENMTQLNLLNATTTIPTALSNETNSEATSTPTPTLSNSTTAVTLEATTPKKRKRGKLKVKVNSYEMYNRFARNRTLSVFINLRLFSDWPIEFNMTNADKVESLFLGGYFLLDTFLQMWNQTKNLHKLTLVNKKNELCSFNEGKGTYLLRSAQETVQMNKLEKLTFKQFGTSCSEVVMVLTGKTDMPNLKGVALEKSVIDSKTIGLYQSIFRRNWDTLTHIRFNDTWVTATQPFFGVDIGVLTKVEYVSLDYPSMFVGTRFCDVVRNVKTLVLGKGYMAEENISNLFNCRRLNELKISIKVQTQNSYFNFSFLSEHFTDLKETEVILYHDACDNPTGTKGEKLIRLEGLETLRWPDFTVLSNCQLLFHTFSVPDKDKRTERRFIRNGLFGLFYSLQDQFR